MTNAIMQKAVNLIIDERKRQIEKWGNQNGNGFFEWVSILTEEVGELAEAVNETFFETQNTKKERGGFENILKEAIQVAAVATAIAETVLYKDFYEEEAKR
jgi:NTP pyrophosphatase (non-canonical NTP hydrolase)